MFKAPDRCWTIERLQGQPAWLAGQRKTEPVLIVTLGYVLQANLNRTKPTYWY